jgi:hypothetical protein
MKKKRPAPAKKRKRVGVSDATRASDDQLREALRTADLSKFDKVLAKAIRPPRASA